MDTRAKRFRDNYQFFESFGNVISSQIEAFLNFYKLTTEDHEDIKFINDCKSFLVGNIGEIVRSMKFSRFLDKVVEKYNIQEPIFATNVDKIVRVGDEFKAIFEIKFTTNGKDILLKYNHYKTLKLMAEKLGIPVYIVVERQGEWYIKPIREVYDFAKNGKYWNKRLRLSEMAKLSYEMLASILR